MALSSYARDKILDHLLRGAAFTQPAALWISLHTADPGLTGANEVVAGGYTYARKDASSGFAAAGSGSKATNADFQWDNMPAGDVAYVGVWDDPTAGNFLIGGQCAISKTLGAGDSYKLPSGQVVGTAT